MSKTPFFSNLINLLLAGECSQGDIRLADGPTDSEGRVEICIGSTWGTISLFGWSAVDARVVCSELGFTNEGKIIYVIYFSKIFFFCSCIFS